MRDLIAAEWLKLRTTRLLLGLVLAAVAISVAAVAGSVLAVDRSDVLLTSSEGLRRVLPVTGTGALLMLLAGILISAGEHHHGTAADTFLTTPRRGQVLAAKLAVGAAVGTTTGVLMSLAAVVAAVGMYQLKEAALPFGEGEMWWTLSGVVTYTTLFAAVGVALGALVRSQVAAVAAALAWVAIVEHILVNLVPDLGRWLPAAAGQAIIRTPFDGLLSPTAGVAVLAAYAVVFAATGVRVTEERDV